jgi:hypothetical protein
MFFEIFENMFFNKNGNHLFVAIVDPNAVLVGLTRFTMNQIGFETSGLENPTIHFSLATICVLTENICFVLISLGLPDDVDI